MTPAVCCCDQAGAGRPRSPPAKSSVSVSADADGWSAQELVFAPLGGVGEIGMNLSIYGLGDERRRQLAGGRSRRVVRRRGASARAST